MPLKRLVPATLYDQATTAHPYRFNGGGRADMAQAGGPDGANAQAVLDAIEAAIGEAS